MTAKRKTTEEALNAAEQALNPDPTLETADWFRALLHPKRKLVEAYQHAQRVKMIGDRFNERDAQRAEVLWKLQRD